MAKTTNLWAVVFFALTIKFMIVYNN